MRLIQTRGKPIKAWTDGVPFDAKALQQVHNVASLPFVHQHVAVMPDVHWGIGATVGSVIATKSAIIPAAVGVDIGCGMVAIRTTVHTRDLPDSLTAIREDIENAIPVGDAQHGAASPEFRGVPRLTEIVARHPRLVKLGKGSIHERAAAQGGTLGGGNHFIELCVDEADSLWLMLHSGSRGVGNMIGRYFIALAKDEMRVHHVNLPDTDLSYFSEGTRHFDDYVEAVSWAQRYASENRAAMMRLVLKAIAKRLPSFSVTEAAINCHHNYVEREHHFGADVWLTRKGAVRARQGDLGIIPGSMGTRSYIVRGKGNADSFNSCSHGAGRVMSRGEARRRISVADHVAATVGVECRKDEHVLDESPAAYKDIDAVMDAQRDLVEVVHTLKQILCVKG